MIKSPIRKKAWHRAMKRKALWAIVPYSALERIKESGLYAKVIPSRYCDETLIYIIWPNGYTYPNERIV